MSRRLTGAALAVVLVAIGVACSGGDSASDATPVASTVASQSRAVTAAATMTAVETECTGGPNRNHSEPELNLSLAHPICLMFGQKDSDMTLAVELSGQAPKTYSISPGTKSFVLPDDLSPYGKDGCENNSAAVLTARLATSMGATPLNLIFHCSAATDPAVCATDAPPTDIFAIDQAGHTCVWLKGTSSSRSGYRVDMPIGATGQVFAYFVPASAKFLLLPDEAAPHVEESPEHCRERKVFTLSVWELKTAAESLAGSNAVQLECRIY